MQFSILINCVLIKWCFGNMQQVYRKTPTPKCDFNKVARRVVSVSTMVLFMFGFSLFNEKKYRNKYADVQS